MNRLNSSSIWRISLFRALVLMTLLALGIGLYGAYRNNQAIENRAQLREAQQEAKMAEIQAEAADVQAENVKLRAQLGFLTIGDEEKIHALRLEEFRPNTWRYRVYLPPGRNYYAACQVNDLPQSDASPDFGKNLPGTSTIGRGKNNSLGMGLDSGVYLITISVFKDVQGKWRNYIECSTPEVSSLMNPDGNLGGGAAGTELVDSQKWPIKEFPGVFTVGVGSSQEVVAAQELLILLDHRVFEKNSGDSTEGVMAWVAPAE